MTKPEMRETATTRRTWQTMAECERGPAACAAALAAMLLLAGTASAEVEMIVAPGDAALDGNGTFKSAAVGDFNDAGQILIGGSFQDLTVATQVPLRNGTRTLEASGSLLFDGSQLIQVARGGDVAPGVSTFGGTPRYEAFGSGSLNNDGEVVFTADLRDTSFPLDELDPSDEFDDFTLWRHNSPGSGAPTLLLREAEFEPGGDGEFGSFSIEAFNDTGGPVIRALLRGTDGDPASSGADSRRDDEAAYVVTSPGALTQVFRESVIGFGPQDALINGNGSAAAEASDVGLYRPGSPSALQGSRVGDTVPGVGTTYTGVASFSLSTNNSGAIAWSAGVTPPSGSPFSFGLQPSVALIDRGLGAGTEVLADFSTPLIGVGNPHQRLLHARLLAIDGAGNAALRPNFGTLNTASTPSFQEGMLFLREGVGFVVGKTGATAPGGGTYNFNSGAKASLTNGGQMAFEDSGGNKFMTDGFETVRLSSGQYVFGSGGEDGRNTSFNKYAQAAYSANGAVYIWTPDVYWRGTEGDGEWDSVRNWTLSINPAHVHDVTIGGGVTVTGSAQSRTIESLTLGGTQVTPTDPYLATPAAVELGESLYAQAGTTGAQLNLKAGTTLTTRDNYTQHGDATLGIDLQTTSSISIVNVGGQASLSGTAALSVGAGFTPTSPNVLTGGYGFGQTVTVLNATGGVTGSFANVTGTDYADRAHTGKELRVVKMTNSVLVGAFQYAAGDTQFDDDVDNQDLQGILGGGRFGQGQTNALWSQGDFDNDGDADNTDLQRVLLHGRFGGGNYVTEPTSGPGGDSLNPTLAEAALSKAMLEAAMPTLTINADGTATLDTAGLTLNSFIFQSFGEDGLEGGFDGYFTGTAVLPATPFQINNADEASATFINVNSASYSLGQLARLTEVPLDPSLLTFTYTYVGGTAIYNGVITGAGVVPEPTTLALLAVAGAIATTRRQRCAA